MGGRTFGFRNFLFDENHSTRIFLGLHAADFFLKSRNVERDVRIKRLLENIVNSDLPLEVAGMKPPGFRLGDHRGVEVFWYSSTDFFSGCGEGFQRVSDCLAS